MLRYYALSLHFTNSAYDGVHVYSGSIDSKRAGIGRLMPDIHFIWRPANWPDRPIRALRASHGFDEYLVRFYGFNARRQSRWFAHRTFIFCGRQSCGLTDGPPFSCRVLMAVCHAVALSSIALSALRSVKTRVLFHTRSVRWRKAILSLSIFSHFISWNKIVLKKYKCVDEYFAIKWKNRASDRKLFLCVFFHFMYLNKILIVLLIIIF